MAVQAVDGVKETTPAVTTEESNTPGKKDYSNMTAKEIINADKAGETVPAEILSWAKENPDSKDTYKTAQGGAGAQQEENDAVAYRMSMEEEGTSLKDMCKQFTQMSAQKEERDLKNVGTMGGLTGKIPVDDQNGINAATEVSDALNEIAKDSFKNFNFKKMKEGIKFFDALKQGNSNELNTIDDSLESIQDVLNGIISDAKDSKQYGDETVKVGKEFKSSTKWWKFKNRRVAKKAIEQGENTVKMSERTDKLAQALSKANGAALSNSKNNMQTVEQAELEETAQGQGDGSKESAGIVASAPTPAPTTTSGTKA